MQRIFWHWYVPQI
ncbi:hypothetical protein RDI58_011388 [Solanum bulbocastanum]|uniref:Uncharacterized protein n=1 Tax=Solanum bulbocastanum TaxID=147425 RepID=A0AAN8TWS6_SOLBU